MVGVCPNGSMAHPDIGFMAVDAKFETSNITEFTYDWIAEAWHDISNSKAQYSVWDYT